MRYHSYRHRNGHNLFAHYRHNTHSFMPYHRY